MTAPLIGVTTFHTESAARGLRFLSVTETYIRALIHSGAVPVMVPLGLPEGSLREVFNRLDGVLFTGGGDIDPARYGAAPHPKVADIDSERDETEIRLAQDAASSGLPFLGICRGLQTVNVALGGTLYEDIQAQRPGSLKHDCFADAPRTWMAHQVLVQSGSALAAILGREQLPVNSGHHQAVRDLASGLLASAHAPDGVVEGLELPGHPFGLAVQWHPEWLQDQSPMQALFKAFVHAAADGGSRAPRD